VPTLPWGGAAGLGEWLRGGLAGGYAGVAEEGGDGGGGGVGEGGPDGGLVLFGPVEDLDVQRVDQGFDQVGGGGGELVGQVGQLVQQGRVVVRGCGGGQLV
jgi:hypothetical protein